MIILKKFKYHFLIFIFIICSIEYSLSMSTESEEILESIRYAKLNEFNLRDVINHEQLQEIRAEYEKALVSGKEAMLDKFTVSTSKQRIAGVDVYEYVPSQFASNDVILHIHGGAFVLLSAASSYAIPSQIACICGIKVISIDYGLAPENKYSAMVDQVVSVATSLLSKACNGNRLMVLGESAGCALCVSASYEMAKIGLNIEKIILLSPWVDLCCDAVSDDIDDPILRKSNYLDVVASLVVANERDKKLLPFSLKYAHFPSTLIQYGTNEILANQATVFCKLLKSQGVSVKEESFQGLWHVFQSYADLPEAKIAMHNIKTFISDF